MRAGRHYLLCPTCEVSWDEDCVLCILQSLSSSGQSILCLRKVEHTSLGQRAIAPAQDQPTHLCPNSEHGRVVLKLYRDNPVHSPHLVHINPFLPNSQPHQVSWYKEPLLKETRLQLSLLLLGHLEQTTPQLIHHIHTQPCSQAPTQLAAHGERPWEHY